mmetsp:Transcript_19698/g.29154  ORF Transcript_19698/g.29154 Transcript_19698/m.29154 type:complete len:231 (-) Transcript_19698:1446-2138(-)
MACSESSPPSSPHVVVPMNCAPSQDSHKTSDLELAFPSGAHCPAGQRIARHPPSSANAPTSPPIQSVLSHKLESISEILFPSKNKFILSKASNDAGTFPESLLKDSPTWMVADLSVMPFKKVDGMAPSKSFESKESSFRAGRVSKAGRFPVRAPVEPDWWMCKYWILERLSNSLGNAPVKELSDKSNRTRSTNKPTSEGIFPSRALAYKLSSVNAVSVPIVVGRIPVICA